MLKRLSQRKNDGDEYRKLSDVELYTLLREKKGVAEVAFRELYSRHSGRIYAYCRCVFGDVELTKDIFQDTFLRFYESAKKDREVTNVAAYLVIIARNLCLNAKRAAKPLVEFEEYRFPQSGESGDRKEMLQLIGSALKLLPEDLREVFVLREMEDMAYPDIASVLCISEGNARVKVTRARHKIRETLQPYISEMTA